MFERIQKILDEKCRIDRTRPLIVGVSGGADSLFLMDVLCKLGYPITVAHLDHGLRPSSREEMERIHVLASEYLIPFVYSSEDVRDYAERQSLSIEEAARNIRYRFLFEQAQAIGAQAVAVGHTANDQVETVLMHFLRGSGSSGLCGMDVCSLPNPWSAEIALIRPLLSTWRDEIQTALDQTDLQPTQDESNLDTQFYRNRLRLELIPFLDQLNPGVQKRILQTANILSADEIILDRLINEIWSDIVRNEEIYSIAIDRARFETQPLAIRRRLIRRMIASLRPGLRNIDFEVVERALKFAAVSTRSNLCDLAAGLRLELDGDLLWLAERDASLPFQDWPQLETSMPIRICPNEQILISNGWRLLSEIVAVDKSELEIIKSNQNLWKCWLNFEKSNSTLFLRCRQPGDRIQPLGMSGHSLKLSDYWINHQLPRRARPHWPLIATESEIAWIPGYTISNSFALDPGSKKSLLLSLIPKRQAES